MTTAKASKPLTQYWQEQITIWKQSSLTQKLFCEQHDLDYHRFGYWRRKFQKQAAPLDQVQRPGGFVTVQQTPDSVTTRLVLVLPNGVRIQGIESGNLPVVTQLLRQWS